MVKVHAPPPLTLYERAQNIARAAVEYANEHGANMGDWDSQGPQMQGYLTSTAMTHIAMQAALEESK